MGRSGVWVCRGCEGWVREGARVSRGAGSRAPVGVRVGPPHPASSFRALRRVGCCPSRRPPDPDSRVWSAPPLSLCERNGRAPIHSTVVGLAAMFVTCLGPAAWVLSHLEEYKKRE
uniref:Uncharacterized protein n=1 Tax=Coturnix japonica TaxID=93934 RepID=A0A8C2SNQ1_COTJA